MQTILHIERSEDQQLWLQRQGHFFRSNLFEREIDCRDITSLHVDDLRALHFELEVALHDIDHHLETELGDEAWARRASRAKSTVLSFRWAVRQELQYRRELRRADEHYKHQQLQDKVGKEYQSIVLSLVEQELGRDGLLEIRKRARAIMGALHGSEGT